MAEHKRITLYAAVDSPFVHRVRLALEEAKATYDIIWIDLLNKPEWYQEKVNPTGKIPVLVYGGPKLHADEEPSPEAERLTESLVILEFLVDIFPEARLLPTDPVSRARARLFYETVETVTLQPFFRFIFLDAPAETVLSALETLQAMLPPSGFVVGDWSIADAAFVAILIRLEVYLKNGLGAYRPEVGKEALEAFESPRFARLRTYLEDNKARPSMAKAFEEDAVKTKMQQRVERFRKTGIVNGFFRLPLPSTE
ncbi:thioredoxin-like protein [Pilatotrama ljubarskyi]|nr:thioredoxin-like protein [Pilatotrama ljubarskyi]